jgi:hypothetical protein
MVILGLQEVADRGVCVCGYNRVPRDWYVTHLHVTRDRYRFESNELRASNKASKILFLGGKIFLGLGLTACRHICRFF